MHPIAAPGPLSFCSRLSRKPLPSCPLPKSRCEVPQPHRARSCARTLASPGQSTRQPATNRDGAGRESRRNAVRMPQERVNYCEKSVISFGLLASPSSEAVAAHESAAARGSREGPLQRRKSHRRAWRLLGGYGSCVCNSICLPLRSWPASPCGPCHILIPYPPRVVK
jgi:hypothetical protein